MGALSRRSWGKVREAEVAPRGSKVAGVKLLSQTVPKKIIYVGKSVSITGYSLAMSCGSMSKPSLRPGVWVVCLTLLSVVLTGMPSAQAAEGDWVQIVQGQPLSARHTGPGGGPALDPRVDLTGVWVRENPEHLWVRLETREGPGLGPLGEGTRIETTFTFNLQRSDDSWTRHLFEVAADDEGFTLFRDGTPVSPAPFVLKDGAEPWAYTIGLLRDEILPGASLELGDVLGSPVAQAVATHSYLRPATDRAPGTGTGSDYTVRLASDGGVAPVWSTVEGVDFAAAPSVSIAGDGTVNVAYIVYNDERGTEKGLYHAVLRQEESVLDRIEQALPTEVFYRLEAERVADAAMPDEIHQNDKGATALAVDEEGRPHIVFHPLQGDNGPGEIRYAVKTDDSWSVLDPAGGNGPVDDSLRSVPALAVGHGRVVVAFQSGDNVKIVEREGGSWRAVATVEHARFPNLALDSKGDIHVAWFNMTDGTHDVFTGEIRYANEKEGFQDRLIAQGVEDRSGFWETTETDGSFSFALDPQDRPHFVWETRDRERERSYGILDGEDLVVEDSGLEPRHGNLQIRMRLVIDGDGNSHIVTGYGGSDIYAMRSPEGGWVRTHTDRYDMFGLGVGSDGTVAVVYTQPHGGTTIALDVQDRPGVAGEAPPPNGTDPRDFEGPRMVPAPAFWLLMVPLGGLVVAARRLGHKAVSAPEGKKRGRRPACSNRPHILCVLLLHVVLLVPVAGTAFMHDDPTSSGDEEWTIFIEDGLFDTFYDLPGSPPAVDPPADLHTVHIRETGGHVWFRLSTLASELKETNAPNGTGLGYRTLLEFRITTSEPQQTQRVEIEAFDEEFFLKVNGVQHDSYHLMRKAGAVAWDYEVGLSRYLFGTDRPLVVGDVIDDAKATSQGMTGLGVDVVDRAPDVGTMGAFVLEMEPPALPAWMDGEGPDFAAGPSAAAGPDGSVHLAYVVYNDRRGTQTGLYHAILEADESTGYLGIQATRVSDVSMPDDIHQDDKTTTAIDVDEQGDPHILFYPSPETEPSQIRYATLDGDDWIVEDPTRLADGTTVSVRDDRRAVPAIVADHGRVVAAVQSDADVLLLERYDEQWHRVATVPDARFPNLALDSQGVIHMAWFNEDRDEYDENRAIYGDLRYGKESGSFQGLVVAKDVEDRSRYWDTAQTDGSFAFALDRQDRPHFVWESDSRDDPRMYAILHGEDLHKEPTPLKPVHGNIQIRMRMGIDDSGTSHIVSGYGGTDLYATRSPDGMWNVQEASRVDMFDLVVISDGRVFLTGTQPHGGQTLHLEATINGVPWAGTEEAPPRPQGDEFAPLPFPTALLVVAATGLVIALGFAGGRRLADVNPVKVAPLLAFIGGFSRLDRKKVMDHETRDAIMEAVVARPGRSAARVRTITDVPRSTFFYHLRRLEQEDMLRVRRHGRDLLLYPADVHGNRRPLPEKDQRLLRAIEREPGQTASEYARRVEAEERTIRNRLRRLEQLQMVERYVENQRVVRWSVLHRSEIGEAS